MCVSTKCQALRDGHATVQRESGETSSTRSLLQAANKVHAAGRARPRRIRTQKKAWCGVCGRTRRRAAWLRVRSSSRPTGCRSAFYANADSSAACTDGFQCIPCQTGIRSVCACPPTRDVCFGGSLSHPPGSTQRAHTHGTLSTGGVGPPMMPTVHAGVFGRSITGGTGSAWTSVRSMGWHA